MVARGGLARVRPFTWLPPPLHRALHAWGIPRGFRGAELSSGWQGCGRRPLTSEAHVPRSPAPRGVLGGIRPLLAGSDRTPARPGPKTFTMELRTELNRVHKLAGFVYGACRLRRDKRGDSYLEIDLLLLRLPGIRLRPL